MIAHERTELETLKELHSELRGTGCEISTVWGPPGTGKTYTAVEMWKQWHKERYAPVMVTFSRAARGEMEARLKGIYDDKDLQERIRTLDSIAVKNYKTVSKTSSDEDGKKKDEWKILDAESGYKAILDEESGSVSAVGAGQITGKKLIEWVQQQQWYDESPEVRQMFTPEDNPINCGPIWKYIRDRQSSLQFLSTERKHPPEFGQMLWMLYCFERKIFTFHDAMCYLAISPDWNMRVPPKAVIVDEAQDLSHLQHYCLLRLALSSGVQKMAVIGDPNQAIMTFRRASPYPFSNIYLPDSKANNKDIFLDKTYRYKQNVASRVEKYRQKMGKNWVQDSREVKAEKDGGRFELIKWKTPGEIGELVHRASKGSQVHNVYLMFTNRYIQPWEHTEIYLQKNEIPFGFLSGDGNYAPGGVNGLQLASKNLPASDPKWEFLKETEEKIVFAIFWVNEFLRTPSHASGDMPVSRIYAIGRLTKSVLKSRWRENLGKWLVKQHGFKNNTIRYSEIADSYVPSKEAVKYFADRHVSKYDSLAAGDISVIDTLETRARLLLPTLGTPKNNRMTETPYREIAGHLQKYSLLECLDPKIKISTVHQAKGKECDVGVFIPIGPPSQPYKEWETEMMKVYYVGISRAKEITVVMIPGNVDKEWSNTVPSESWRALASVLQV